MYLGGLSLRQIRTVFIISTDTIKNWIIKSGNKIRNNDYSYILTHQSLNSLEV